MNLTFFKLSQSLFYVDIFQSLQNSSWGGDGEFKMKGKCADKSITSQPICEERAGERHTHGEEVHILSLFTADPACENSWRPTWPPSARSLPQHIPQNESPGHLPLGRCRTRAYNRVSHEPEN